MITYGYVGGQLYAYTNEPHRGFIWYICWSESGVKLLHPHGRRILPDDIQ